MQAGEGVSIFAAVCIHRRRKIPAFFQSQALIQIG
jgi:hypothetical protein